MRWLSVVCLTALAWPLALAPAAAQDAPSPEVIAPESAAGGERVYQSTQPVWQPGEPNWVEGSATGEELAQGVSPDELLAPDDWRILPRLRRLGERPAGRYRERGGPLLNESWMNRPYSVGLLSGALFLDSPLRGRVNGTAGYMPGVRFGWDMDYYWGSEARIAYTTTGLQTPTNATALANARVLLVDGSILYYPWGDTKWRPYASWGMGLFDIFFTNDVGTVVHQTAFGMPFGVGFKVRQNQRWVFRMDLIDNLSFAAGDQLNTMNSLSLTAGLEYRLGTGPKRSYWPWNPSRSFR